MKMTKATAEREEDSDIDEKDKSEKGGSLCPALATSALLDTILPDPPYFTARSYG